MYLSDNETNFTGEVKSLFDNAVAQKDLFGLTVGTALTTEQRNNLTSDMIWMETVTIYNEPPCPSPQNHRHFSGEFLGDYF